MSADGVITFYGRPDVALEALGSFPTVSGAVSFAADSEPVSTGAAYYFSLGDVPSATSITLSAGTDGSVTVKTTKLSTTTPRLVIADLRHSAPGSMIAPGLMLVRSEGELSELAGFSVARGSLS